LPAKTGAHSIGIGIPGAMWVAVKKGNHRPTCPPSTLNQQLI